MPPTAKKIDWACRKCGSRNVTRDAEAVWSVDKQEWELLVAYDNATCQACGDSGNTVIDAVELPPDPPANAANSVPGTPRPEGEADGSAK